MKIVSLSDEKRKAVEHFNHVLFLPTQTLHFALSCSLLRGVLQAPEDVRAGACIVDFGGHLRKHRKSLLMFMLHGSVCKTFGFVCKEISVLLPSKLFIHKT